MATIEESISTYWEFVPTLALMKDRKDFLLCSYFFSEGLVGMNSMNPGPIVKGNPDKIQM